MASSKVMASTSPPNPDLPRQSASSIHSSSSSLAQATPSVSTLLPQQQPHPSPIPTHHHHLHHSDRSTSPFGSMNMEEILKNIYSEPDSLASAVDAAAIPGVSAVDGDGVVKNVGAVGSKTVDEVWKEIVSGGGGGGGGGGSRGPRMTLEDFLTKAGAVSEEDVRVANPAPPPLPVPAPPTAGAGGYAVDPMMNVQFPVAPGPVVHMQNGPGGFGLESQLGLGNGMVAAASAALEGAGGNGCASGRGKRRAAPVEEVALDKATQQKQRRMIKNRESAARSRERKQAYTVELESMVTQLEEENARLLREEAEQTRERYKQLMENLIPVVEKRRPPRALRRVKSMYW